MEKTEVHLGFADISVPLGSHIVSFYRDLSQMRSVVVPFIRTGLEMGDKCICVVEEETRDGLQEALQGYDVDVEDALASGQLSILTADESYLSQGYFSPEEMVEYYERALRTAIEEGYRVIRISGEVTWALRECPGVERLMEYEAKVHKMLVRYPQVAICHYNITRFRGDMIIDALRVHPICIVGGVLIRNHFYIPPDQFLQELEAQKL